MQVTPGADASGQAGTAADVALGTVTGGVPDGTYRARVQWGDGSVTQDATVSAPGADGVATIRGNHTWATAGTYPVRVLVSDSRSDVLGTLTVTVH